jgi:hypothetical protein
MKKIFLTSLIFKKKNNFKVINLVTKNEPIKRFFGLNSNLLMKRKMEQETETTKQNEIKDEIVSKIKFTKEFSILQEMKKDKCKICNKSRKYFCYDCMVPMESSSELPNVKLPIRVIV